MNKQAVIDRIRKNSFDDEMMKISESEEDREEKEDLKKLIEKYPKVFLSNRLSGIGGALALGLGAGIPLAYKSGMRGNHSLIGHGIRGALLGGGLTLAGGVLGAGISHQINKARNPEFASDFDAHSKKYSANFSHM